MSWVFAILLSTLSAHAERLEGHGGPVMDVANQGPLTLTASFDYSVGLWRDGAPEWLEGHRAAVNAVWCSALSLLLCFSPNCATIPA